MSKGTVTKCDQCGSEETRYDNVFGGIPARDWITVTRRSSTSGCRIGAGTAHFCDDKCLTAYMLKEPTK